MSVQTLISTMNIKTKEEAYSLINKMNARNAIIINQDPNIRLKINGDHLLLRTYNERGLSKSRNKALKLATSKICHIADDDLKLDKEYEKIIEKAYDKYKYADIICFYVKSDNPNRITINQKEGKVKFVKSMRISSYQITFKLDKLRNSGVFFDEKFGAGTNKFTAGEENIFLSDCLKKGLKIYYVPQQIATVSHTDSTWFHGYDENYFKTKGAAFYRMSPNYCNILLYQFAIRKHKLYKNNFGVLKCIKYMNDGKKEYMESN